MSYTEIYAVRKNGDVQLFEENQNAWRWSPQIWRELDKRYLPIFRPRYIPRDVPDSQIEEYLGYYPTRENEDSEIRKVWDLFADKRLSSQERWVLGTTFDHVIVLKEDFKEMIQAYREFFSEENNSSLLELADIYEKMAKNDDIVGIAWSISQIQNPWLESYFEEDDEDEEDEIEIPYNIYTAIEPKHQILRKKNIEQIH